MKSYLKDPIPVVETFSARFAIRNDGADVSAGATVAFLATHTGQTDADSGGVVTLLSGGPPRVAETRPARVVGRVAPVVGAALVAATATEPVATFALAVEFVTLSRNRPDRIAIASLASFAGSDFPVIDGATIARQALDVGQARTLARLSVTDRRPFQGGVAAQQITDARRTLLRKSVAEESLLTDLAAETFSVEQTLETLASTSVTVAWSR